MSDFEAKARELLDSIAFVGSYEHRVALAATALRSADTEWRKELRLRVEALTVPNGLPDDFDRGKVFAANMVLGWMGVRDGK